MWNEILSMVVWAWLGAIGARLYMHHFYTMMRKDQMVETTVWNKEGVEIMHWKKGDTK